MTRRRPLLRSDVRALSSAPRARSMAAIGLLIAAALAGSACSHEGAPFDCECDWLTDFDDASKVKVPVCAADEAEAPTVARGCAQIATPAPVQRCTCARAKGAPAPCRHGCRESPPDGSLGGQARE